MSNDIVKQLAGRHKGFLAKLRELQSFLKSSYTKECHDQIDALILALLTGESMLCVGPPGTAKSMIVRRFCSLINLLDADDPTSKKNENYFEFLLTPFTEPTELFGPWDVKQLREGKYVRLENNALQKARIVFLDEVFNGSSAIMNSLLGVMQEGILHDHRGRNPVALRCLFAATNQVPATMEASAFYDRFLIRTTSSNVEPHEVLSLMEKGWDATYGNAGKVVERNPDQFFKEMQEFNKSIKSSDHPLTGLGEDYLNRLRKIIHTTAHRISTMSNRRIIRMLRIMFAHRVYRYAISTDEAPKLKGRIEEEELLLIGRFFVDRFDEPNVLEDLKKLARGAS